MNELALFTGIGGGMLGTAELGISPVCAVELDWHCRCVLVQRQNSGQLRPCFPIWDDICSFGGRPWRGIVDIISGGFPCQAFSTAARGRNVAHNLWPEMYRVVKEVAPIYVFAENVSAAAIERAATDLTALGYKADMLSLSAKDLGGDHVRRRYWLLAYSDDKSKLRSLVNAKARELPELRESIWSAKPGEPRVANGFAGRVERYRAVGNGQVPVVAAAALWALANAD